MAQLIIAAAGAAIGGALAPGVAFLGLTGASIGWTVGSLIGAQFGPTQRLKGPRLDDLKVTGVEYGQPIGWAAGHPRIAGQIWWASDKREIATTTEVGKGGGGAEVTSYTYEIDLLVGLLDRQIGGVSRVWANGKLVYTKLATSGTESALSSKSQTTWRRMTVYTGSETQLPDPTYETAVGVGYAPAYRDRGTVFIEGLQLGGSGQLPNLTFEAYMAGDEEGRAAQTLGTFAYTLGDDGGIPAMALPSFTHHIKGSTSTEILVYRYTLGLEEMELVTTYDMVASGNNPSYANSDVSGQFMVNIGSTAAYWYDDDGTGTSFTLPYNMNPATINVVFCRRDGVVLLGNVSKTAGDEKIYKGSSAGGTFGTSSAAMAEAVRSIAISGSNCYALNAPIGSADPTAIYVLDLATLTLQGTLTPPSGTDFRGQLITDENDYLYCFTGSTDEVYRLDGGSTWTLVKVITGGLEYGQAGTRLCMVGGDLWCITMPGGGDDAELRVVFDSVTLTDATVQDTVDDLCTRAGMPAGTWSSTALSAITTPVRALVVAQVAPVRSVLEQLASAYAFDAYCADKLYFVPRGGAVAATPGTNDLGCGEEEAAAELLPVRVQEDASIPAQISLTYLNADADYNAATEHSDRLATDASNTATVQMPMAFTAAAAKTICDVMLADAYTGRIGGEATLPLAYSRHTPTDVLTLTDADGTTYRARVVRREQAGPVVKLEWVLDDTTALVSAGITSDDYTPSLTVALPGPTALTLLDIPILRDADDSAGIYAAAKPTGTVWPGAKLMTSVAGGDYTEAGSFTSRAVVGETTVALTSWTGGNVVDEGGSVTVDVGAGELSSSTRDALLNTDANAMLVGSEIIQFRIATLVSTGVYKLTGLLRGRRGTEHAMTGHAIGETVVLLRTAGLLRVSYDAARIGTSADYKAVTLGKTLASATTRSIVDSGIALKPFAPADLRVSASTAQAIDITWSRRTRLSFNSFNSTGLPIPLGEASESYLVTIATVSPAATLRTIAATSESASYTRAQQVADGLTLGTAILISVQQLSATVGAGYAATIETEAAATTLPQVSQITVGGVFDSGADLNVVLGSTVVDYTTVGGDTDLDGIAASLAAAIDATADYSATSSGPVVQVTGPVSATYYLNASVLPGDNTIVASLTQAAAAVSAGTSYYAWIDATPRVDIPAGTFFQLRFQQPVGTAIGALTYSASSGDTAIDVLYGLAEDMQNNPTLLALGYSFSVFIPPERGYEVGYVFGPIGVATVALSNWAIPPGALFISTLQQGSAATVDQPQVSTVTLSGTPSDGWLYRVTLAGVAFDFTATVAETTMDLVAAELAAVIDADADYIAAAVGSVITITHASDNVAFTCVPSIVPSTVTLTAAITQEAA